MNDFIFDITRIPEHVGPEPYRKKQARPDKFQVAHDRWAARRAYAEAWYRAHLEHFIALAIGRGRPTDEEVGRFLSAGENPFTLSDLLAGIRLHRVDEREAQRRQADRAKGIVNTNPYFRPNEKKAA